MAIWAGSSINSNETAMVFNKLHNKSAVPIIVKRNATWYAMMNKSVEGKRGGMKINRNPSTTGKKIEIRLLGALPTPASISRGSTELTAATISYNSAYYGGLEVDYALYGLVEGVPASELERFRGDEAKTLSYLDDVYKRVMYAYEKVYGDAFQANTAPSSTALGGWPYWVDDSNTVGTLDRSDSGNADFRGVVAATFGDTTVAKIQAQRNTARANNGNPDLMVMGTTLYSKYQQVIQPYSQATYSASGAEWGADDFTFAGMRGVLDQRTASGYIGLLDSETWTLYGRPDGMTRDGITSQPLLNSGYVMNTYMFLQVVCEKPNSNVKITGAS